MLCVLPAFQPSSYHCDSLLPDAITRIGIREHISVVFRRLIHSTPFPLPRQGDRYIQSFIVRISHSTCDRHHYHNTITSYNIPHTTHPRWDTFFVINSGIHATAGGYLQSTVVGVAALFGEQALQRLEYFTGPVRLESLSQLCDTFPPLLFCFGERGELVTHSNRMAPSRCPHSSSSDWRHCIWSFR